MKLTSGIDDVKIKIGRKGNNACGAELMGVLACLDRHEGKESSCKEVMGALKRCMAQASALKKTNHHKAPINYYLQQARETHPHTLTHTHSPTHTHPHTLTHTHSPTHTHPHTLTHTHSPPRDYSQRAKSTSLPHECASMHITTHGPTHLFNGAAFYMIL
jgi:hypothetical protein